MSTPVTWYFDITDRVLRDSNGIRIRNDDKRPFATLSQKFRVNIQVVTDSALTAYTGWEAGTTFRFTVDDDYSNPPPYLPLYGDSSDSWTSTTGSEYKYVGETISSEPSEVQINGSAASEGTVGSLAAGEWGWDSSTGLHVRLSDDTDPDTKADGYVSQRPSGTYTQPFIYVDDDTIQETGTWGATGADPDITSGQLSLYINANRTAFYERLDSNELVRCTAQIHILNSSEEFMELLSFTFIARNIMLGDAPSLELDVYPYYTKGESDLRYSRKLSALSDIGEALANDDTLRVGNTSDSGAERTSTFSRLWTKIQAWLATYKLDDFAAPDDNTDLNASTARHGLMKKLSNVATQVLNGAGNWIELQFQNMKADTLANLNAKVSDTDVVDADGARAAAPVLIDPLAVGGASYDTTGGYAYLAFPAASTEVFRLLAIRAPSSATVYLTNASGAEAGDARIEMSIDGGSTWIGQDVTFTAGGSASATFDLSSASGAVEVLIRRDHDDDLAAEVDLTDGSIY